MEDEEGLEKRKSQEPPGVSANTATTRVLSTATGQSPPKKQKGDQGSDGQ